MRSAIFGTLSILACILGLEACGEVSEGPEGPSPAPAPEVSDWCRATALRMTDRYLREYPGQEAFRAEFLRANESACAGAAVIGPFSSSVDVEVASESMKDQCSSVFIVDSSTDWGSSEPPYYIICQHPTIPLAQ